MIKTGFFTHVEAKFEMKTNSFPKWLNTTSGRILGQLPYLSHMRKKCIFRRNILILAKVIKDCICKIIIRQYMKVHHKTIVC